MNQTIAEFSIINKTNPDVPATATASERASAKADALGMLDWDKIFTDAQSHTTLLKASSGFPFSDSPEAFKTAWNELTANFSDIEKRMASIPFLKLYASQERFLSGNFFRANSMDQYVRDVRFAHDTTDLIQHGDVFFPDEYTDFIKGFLSKLTDVFADYKITTPDENSGAVGICIPIPNGMDENTFIASLKQSVPPKPSGHQTDGSHFSLLTANDTNKGTQDISDVFKNAINSYHLGATQALSRSYGDPMFLAFLT